MIRSFSKKILFPGADNSELAAALDLPQGQSIAYALFAHCFTCSKDTLAAARISQALTQYGIAVFRFDFTGLGGSEGDFANTNFSSNILDLISATNYLREHYEAPQILIGHSLGGAAILAVANKIEEAKAIVTIESPADPLHVKDLFKHKLAEIEENGIAEVNLAGRQFHIKNQFLLDLEQQHLIADIAALKKPLLIFHSPQDNIVDISNAITIFNASPFPKNFITLDNADHLLTHKEDSVYVARVLAAWASRYITRKEPVNKFSGEGQVIVHETKDGKFAQEIIIGDHVLTADEPQAYGGNDQGPSPYDLLLAALGACTSMTLRMYADKNKMQLDNIIVKLKHEKIHAEACEDCEKNSDAKIDKILRLIELKGNLTAQQREKLLSIANKCPVHRTLTSNIHIETKLVG